MLRFPCFINRQRSLVQVLFSRKLQTNNECIITSIQNCNDCQEDGTVCTKCASSFVLETSKVAFSLVWSQGTCA